jgi:AcrR family transcriptional regulator
VRGEDTRTRLLAAARMHLEERGLEGLTLREIARRSGVSHGAPLRHFPGLGDLLAEVAAEGFRDLRESIVEAVASAPAGCAPFDRLMCASRGYVNFAFAHRGVFELMFQHIGRAAASAELTAESAAALQVLSQLVGEAQGDGWQQDEHIDAVVAALWSAVHGFVVLWLSGAMPSALARAGGSADRDLLLDHALRVVAGRGSISGDA